jgi:hypothetical protein
MGADQRHEADGAKLLLLISSLARAGDLEQLLHLLRLADRHHQPPADLELLEQQARPGTWLPLADTMIASNGPSPEAARAVAFVDRDILVAEPLHPLAGSFGELGVPLDRDHLVTTCAITAAA